ncbi:MAG: HYR domain-containing protein, partial [Gammaproteobacteria bacterium]|nr:HYR domain-containing protein [Gammaproteobacteria bacterium]
VDTDNGACSYTHSGTGWDASGTDNCPGFALTYILSGATSGTGASLNNVLFNKGITTVEWTNTDAAANTAACSYTVTVEDNEDPTVSCTTNHTVDTDNGACSYTHSGTGWDGTGSDNCPGFAFTYILSGATSGTGASLNNVLFNKGITTVEWTNTDAAGNTATCSYTVTVEDNEDPTILGLPSDIYQSGDIGSCQAIVSWSNPSVTDNCSATLTSTHSPGDTFPTGTTTVIYTATDVTGNSIDSTFVVVISDTENPVISGIPSDINQNTDAGSCSAVVSWIEPIAGDDCSAVLTSTHNPGETFPSGTTNVTYTATDAAGNFVNENFKIVVTDAENPEIILSEDIYTCDAVVYFDDVSAIDNCSATIEKIDDTGLSSGDAFPTGETVLTYRATDGNNNSIEKSFSVTVHKSPVINAGSDTVVYYNEVVVLSGTVEDAISFYWSPSSMLEFSSSLNPEYIAHSDMEFVLVAENEHRCVSSDSVWIRINRDQEIKIHNILTPNNDGVNDTWKINNPSLINAFSVQIFNKAGAIVYINYAYDNSWDGRRNGELLPSGAYYYIIKDGDKIVHQGSITIVR